MSKDKFFVLVGTPSRQSPVTDKIGNVHPSRKGLIGRIKESIANVTLKAKEIPGPQTVNSKNGNDMHPDADLWSDYARNGGIGQTPWVRYAQPPQQSFPRPNNGQTRLVGISDSDPV